MREIVLDTETTGLDPYQGHRLVEIGCVELFNRIPTGQTLHRYLNPERDMPAEAFAIHGLSLAFLKDKPCFAELVEEFLDEGVSGSIPFDERPEAQRLLDSLDSIDTVIVSTSKTAASSLIFGRDVPQRRFWIFTSATPAVVFSSSGHHTLSLIGLSNQRTQHPGSQAQARPHGFESARHTKKHRPRWS